MTAASMPDPVAAVYAAALAVRQAVRFGECIKVVALHDAAAILAWLDEAMPSPLEISSSYGLLLSQAAEAEPATAAAGLTALALVEAILVDHANDRVPAAPEEPEAAVRIVRRLRQAAHSAMLAEQVAGAIGRQQKATDAPIGRSIIAMVARRREIAFAPARGDADLIAKTGHADEMVRRTGGGDLYPLLLGLFADIERVVGDRL